MMTSPAAVPEQTASYNPAQQAVIDLLGRGGVRAVLDAELHRELRHPASLEVQVFGLEDTTHRPRRDRSRDE